MEKLSALHTEKHVPELTEAEKQQGFVDQLREKGFVTEYIPYQDTKGFTTRSLDKIPKDIRDDVQLLLKFLNSPVLKDTIEEKYDDEGGVIKGTRAHINEYTKSQGLEMQTFYNLNKLAASNISQALYVSSWMADEGLLSQNTVDKLESIRSTFAPKDSASTDYSIGQYYSFSREQKYAFEKEYTALLEDVLSDIFEKYGI